MIPQEKGSQTFGHPQPDPLCPQPAKTSARESRSAAGRVVRRTLRPFRIYRPDGVV